MCIPYQEGWTVSALAIVLYCTVNHRVSEVGWEWPHGVAIMGQYIVTVSGKVSNKITVFTLLSTVYNVC